jgi:hypothetical protein
VITKPYRLDEVLKEIAAAALKSQSASSMVQDEGAEEPSESRTKQATG